MSCDKEVQNFYEELDDDFMKDGQGTVVEPESNVEVVYDNDWMHQQQDIGEYVNSQQVHTTAEKQEINIDDMFDDDGALVEPMTPDKVPSPDASEEVVITHSEVHVEGTGQDPNELMAEAIVANAVTSAIQEFEQHSEVTSSSGEEDSQVLPPQRVSISTEATAPPKNEQEVETKFEDEVHASEPLFFTESHDSPLHCRPC